MSKKIDMIGKRFGRLVVIKESERKGKAGQIYYLCKCDCGNEKEISGESLRSGNVQSCKCLHNELTGKLSKKINTTHGMTKTRLYKIYDDMKGRCYNSKSKSWKDYGERGIKICNEWLSDFLNFYNWSMNNGYTKNITIDRIDVNGNYEPSNCRWVTRLEQGNNKRNNRLIEYEGKVKTVSEWSKITGISDSTISYRYLKGFPIEQVFYKGNLQRDYERSNQC